MTNKTTKQPTIKLIIMPGPVTTHQRVAWERFWQRLISECKSEGQK